MKEFKFNCPKCGQHILAETDWVGRNIKCPSCDSPITIPPAREEAAQDTPVPARKSGGKRPPLASAGQEASTITGRKSIGAASPGLGSGAAQAVSPASTDKTKAPESSPGETDSLRVAVLTPGIKLEMVRAVRKRISDESCWIPGQIERANAYAAKVRNGETIPVDVKSPEAKRFSLIGAFLLEFHLRQVVRTAAGRKKLLDQEIPDAVQEVLMAEMSEEEREQNEDGSTEAKMMAITHAQCLAVLQVLEDRYSQRMEQVRAEQAKRKLGSTRLPDLVKRLEKKARITPEDVATALYHELIDIGRRLDRLESKLSKNK